MSTEARLARLGLLHLVDKPDELKKALEARLEIEKDKLRLMRQQDVKGQRRKAFEDSLKE